MVNLQNGNGSKTNMWTSVTYLVRKCRHPTSAMQLWIPWKHEEDPRRMSQFTRKYEWSSDFVDYSFSDDSYRCWITVPCITIHIKTQLSHLLLKWNIFPSWEILIQADSLYKKRSKSLTSPTSCFWFPTEPVAKRLLHQWWGPWINVKLWGFHLEAVKFHGSSHTFTRFTQVHQSGRCSREAPYRSQVVEHQHGINEVDFEEAKPFCRAQYFD